MWGFCFPLPCESSGFRSGRNAFLFAEAAHHRFPRFGFQLLGILKVAVNTIVPRSSFFAFCSPKYRLLQTQNKMRSNVCVNEMALFGPFAAFVKGKTFFDSHGEKGGLPTRRDNGCTRYGCAHH